MHSCANPPTREAFLAALRAYDGVAWRHQGRDRRGIDCLGLIVLSARDIGIQVVDNLNYGRVPDFETMRAGLREHFAPVGPRDLLAGDLYWIQWPRAAHPMHLAVFVGAGYIIHCDERVKKVTEHTMPAVWEPLIVERLRWRAWAA